MGGWLHHAHPLFPWLDWWYGAYEAFLERMLMSVILVKDAVEQARFVTNPEKLRRDGCSSKVGGVGGERGGDGGGEMGEGRKAAAGRLLQLGGWGGRGVGWGQERGNGTREKS
jgi:hypothetical protein